MNKKLLVFERVVELSSLISGFLFLIPLIDFFRDNLRNYAPQIYGAWLYVVELRGGVRPFFAVYLGFVAGFIFFSKKVFIKFGVDGRSPDLSQFKCLVEFGFNPVFLLFYFLVRFLLLITLCSVFGFLFSVCLWGSMNNG